ncbi:hypothetical protein cand_038860 [Cryptosporidium andersoni]|uniref:Uncharacterized protein n=1 Tax=Cryptosporidium andersoni TaxID=117008 RepID=A0A1J4MFM9_9CRYT|nr:hypothetical protein cand_038860 [Cryptosporidium andersoni]
MSDLGVNDIGEDKVVWTIDTFKNCDLKSYYLQNKNFIDEVTTTLDPKDQSVEKFQEIVVLLTRLIENDDFRVGDVDIRYQKNIMELIEFVHYTLIIENESIMNNLIILQDGINGLCENKSLPILLSILIDCIHTYNKMIKRQSGSLDLLLDISLWSIKLMDTIYATNGGNITLLDYTIQRIYDQYPSILSVFDEIEYIDKIIMNCDIEEIYRKILRIEFGFNQRYEVFLNNGSNYLNKEIIQKYTENAKQIIYLLKQEFTSLNREVYYLSKYLGLKTSVDENQKDHEVNNYSKEENSDFTEVLSNIDIEEIKEILQIFDLLYWLKTRINTCLGNAISSEKNSTSTLKHQDTCDTCYYNECFD